ncbi:MAG: 4-hydroxy-tetrahydrodipicolinate reductase [Legionella sp.]|nr:4-hydroxy-tetrahydrodipicolinate reductase [Legionella sp.]
MQNRIIVNGAKGKMGRLACDVLNEHADFEVVASLNRGDNLRKIIKDQRADIVLDLTRADSVYKNSLAIIESGAHPVIGTSGLLPAEIKNLQAFCQEQKLGGLIVPNFSLGVMLMMRFAAEAARYLKDVAIIEYHHPQKFDAPSGTALRTAEMIAEALKQDKSAGIDTLVAHSTDLAPLSSQETVKGVRGGEYEGIPIHALRLSGILARQEVIFGSPGETFTLTHNSTERAAFMPGVILACKRVRQLDGLYCGLEHAL